MAKNVSEALRKERQIKADEAWVDEDWKKNNSDLCEFKIKGVEKK
jgi:hypothetical protein